MADKEHKSKKAIIISQLIIYVILFFVVWVGISALIGGIGAIFNKQEFNLGKFLIDPICLGVSAGVWLFICGWLFYNLFLKNRMYRNKTKRAKNSLHDDSRFFTEKELYENYGDKTKRGFIPKSWDNIKNEVVNGMVIKSWVEGGKTHHDKGGNPFVVGGDLKFLSGQELHSLIVGTTGVGKTKFLIIPTMELMIASKNKPSVVNLDVKGEIREKTEANAIKNGYQTYTINLRDTDKSSKFNPFFLVMFYYKKYLASKKKDMKSYEKAVQLLKAITNMFKQQGNDAFWSNAPAQLIETYIWSLLDNYEYCSFNRGTPFVEQDETLINVCKKKIHNFGTEKGVSFRAIEDISTLNAEELYKYFAYRYSNSETYKKANTQVLSGVDIDTDTNEYKFNTTFKSILQTYNNSYNDIIGRTLLQICDDNEVNLPELYHNGKPFILYILMPDEDKTKYPFASLLINFIYSFYTNLAQEIPNPNDRKDIHFIMDEFANLSKLENIDSWLSVGRERHLFCHLFVQGLSQLNDQKKYGAEMTKTIIGNCNMKIFMAISENEVIDYAIKLFGTYTVEQSNVSFSSQNGTGANVSQSFAQANLVNAGEFKRLKNGSIFFMETKKCPSKANILGSFSYELGSRFGYDVSRYGIKDKPAKKDKKDAE